MNCFESIRKVLDTKVEQIFGANELSKDDAAVVVARLRAMSEAWNSGGAPVLERSKCRFAYTYCYGAAHAYLSYLALGDFYAIRNLVRDRIEAGVPLRVCILGAGPGADVFGIIKYLRKRIEEDEKLVLKVTLADAVEGWKSQQNCAAKVISEFLADTGTDIEVETTSVAVDLTKAGSDVDSLTGNDLYLANHLFSELKDHPGDFATLVKEMADSMSEDGVFVIADRNEQDVLTFAKETFKNAGLQVTSATEHYKIREFAEDADVLKPYSSKINWSPRTHYEGGVFVLSGYKAKDE